jgi:hypothetical protein
MIALTVYFFHVFMSAGLIIGDDVSDVIVLFEWMLTTGFL